jgi:hypothetical protein
VSSEKRALQAKKNLDSIAEGELGALTRLASIGYKYAPTILGKKQGTQPDSGLVPGGYILYLAMTRLHGKPLSEDKFWNLPRDSRDFVREAFKTAYLYVSIIYFPLLVLVTLLTYYFCLNRDLLAADVVHDFCDIENLLWEGPRDRANPQDKSERCESLFYT